MTTIAYLDCFGGLAGDMVLGALLDAGAPEHALTEAVAALGLHNVKLEIERVQRNGISAMHVSVVERPQQGERRADQLVRVIEKSALRPRVRSRALATVERLIDVEARIHGVSRERLTVHELSGADTLADIAGTFALLDALDVDDVVCSPVPYGRGEISTAHGVFPAPGPAVTDLLTGALLVGVESSHELVTPTGAAIVAVAASQFGELPLIASRAVGYGAGSRDVSGRANVLRVIVGDTPSELETRDVVLLEATVDDLVPELVPDALEACREAGALDVWTAWVQMKKGRTGVTITAVARPEMERAVAHALLEHSSTLGVRALPIRRYELERSIATVDVDGRQVRVKIGILEGRVVNVAPEHDDCAAVARETRRPVKDVWASALALASRLDANDAHYR